MQTPKLIKATAQDVDELQTLVAAYHAFDGIESTAEKRRAAICGLMDNPALGSLFLIKLDDLTIGYLALCYSFSIEFCGRDVFVDEFYIQDDWRGMGLGSHILKAAKDVVLKEGSVSLTLEVDKDNHKAKFFYEANGFKLRDGYYLMSCLLKEQDTGN